MNPLEYSVSRRGARWRWMNFIGLLWVALVVVAAPAKGQSFRVETIKFCYNKVSDISANCVPVEAPFQGLDRNKFAASNIYVLVSIACEDSALSFLKQTYTLPVIASFTRNGNRYEISKGILQDDWDSNGDALTNLYQTQGRFPWRTRFSIGISGTSSIELQIVDARKNVVYIGHEPARFLISFAN
ncbi:hypothetical protein [Bradyrhizobium elkanii]|uniref:Uncharacterized protein n=1 Tax=Bradyrhizobium elkanii TaxID=29448 RepID=A0A8I1YHE6_BRAEL|nr:hypothetical protein [Bradyrhizobium elkanii]MBP1299776.1 hypothetical protein [Bradyrhizobium elkanii]